MTNMNVEDITHYSKRTQAGNINKAGTSYDELTSKVENNSIADVKGKVPVNVTIESAIQYFRENATGDKTNLYLFTAKILENHRVISKANMLKAFEETKNKIAEKSDVLEVDMNGGVE